jgi:hypothetical protein
MYARFSLSTSSGFNPLPLSSRLIGIAIPPVNCITGLVSDVTCININVGIAVRQIPETCLSSSERWYNGSGSWNRHVLQGLHSR